MPSLLERLNDGLMPDFHVERELARGGMGVVFLAHDTNLNVRVAIKVLLPEMATETAAKRFLREARILAALRHPHIVPVHRVGVADGLHYYVMDYMEGDTLADRLLHGGALSCDEAVKLGRDMLDALETAHDGEVIHRDIKPSNIFLLGRRAVLVDFGIAKPQSDQTETLTQDGFPPGTPLYMTPEQWEQREVTPQTDICSLGMVLYEALTTRPWVSGTNPREAKWTGVPWSLRSVLARALAYSPHDRWPNAQTFRRRLRRTRLYQYWMRAAALAVGGLVVGGTVVWLIGRNREAAPDGPVGALTIQVQQLEVAGDATEPWLGDALASRLEGALRTISEFRVFPRDTIADAKPAVVLGGRVVADDAGFTAFVWSVGRTSPPISVKFTAANWEMVADSVTSRTMRELVSETSPLAPWYPARALPARPEAIDRLLNAERLLTDGQWGDAQKEFHNVVKMDSSCVLCSWRITEIDRWLFTRPIDIVHQQRVLENDSLFPSHFRRLIRARLQLTDRLDTLRIATEEWGDFYYAWFLRGEEELGRGPLNGLLRARAAISLEIAAMLRPEFAPIWWDLAWIYTAEGDKANAARALANAPEPLDQFSAVMSAVLGVAYEYRFGENRAAKRALQQVLENAEIARDPSFPAGPRLLPSFDAPAGAVQLGGIFANISDRPELQRSGLIAQLFGFFAMGRMDAARERARVFQRGYPGDEDFSLFAAQLEAVNSMFDSVGATGDVERITGQLARYAAPDAGTLEQRLSARWILQLLSQRNAAVAVQTGGGNLSDSTTGVQPLDVLLEADRMARAGRPQDALRLAGTIRAWEIAEVVPDRFFRTVLHFLVAEWQTKLGSLQAAVETLRWHEAVDQWELPTASPVVQEIDWAFGTLARWKRAQLLERLGDTGGEICSSFGAVVRLWTQGDPEYASRAEIARRRLQELGCIADR